MSDLSDQLRKEAEEQFVLGAHNRHAHRLMHLAADRMELLEKQLGTTAHEMRGFAKALDPWIQRARDAEVSIGRYRWELANFVGAFDKYWRDAPYREGDAKEAMFSAAMQARDALEKP